MHLVIAIVVLAPFEYSANYCTSSRPSARALDGLISASTFYRRARISPPVLYTSRSVKGRHLRFSPLRYAMTFHRVRALISIYAMPFYTLLSSALFAMGSHRSRRPPNYMMMRSAVDVSLKPVLARGDTAIAERYRARRVSMAMPPPAAG